MNGITLKQTTAAEAREEQGRTIHIHDETGELAYTGNGDGRKPVTMTVAGTYSTRYRKARNALRDRVLKRGRSNAPGEALERSDLELIAACVMAWDGFFAEDEAGPPLPCTKEHVTAFLAAPWIRRQVEDAMEDHEAFFGPASGT